MLFTQGGWGRQGLIHFPFISLTHLNTFSVFPKVFVGYVSFFVIGNPFTLLFSIMREKNNKWGSQNLTLFVLNILARSLPAVGR